MNATITNPNTLLTDIRDTVKAIDKTLGYYTSKTLNQVPFEDSWTMSQVAEHITLSTASITNAMQIEAAPASREPAQRQQELKHMFLNMDQKFKSPAFIVPAKKWYDKTALLENLNRTYSQLHKASVEADLAGIIKHPAFGDITKLELLYFVLYHTQRHYQQIKNIATALETEPGTLPAI